MYIYLEGVLWWDLTLNHYSMNDWAMSAAWFSVTLFIVRGAIMLYGREASLNCLLSAA